MKALLSFAGHLVLDKSTSEMLGNTLLWFPLRNDPSCFALFASRFARSTSFAGRHHQNRPHQSIVFGLRTTFYDHAAPNRLVNLENHAYCSPGYFVAA